VVDSLIGFVALVALYLLIRWAVTRHDRRLEKEREDAFSQHEAETDHRLVASQHRQRNARAVKAARLRQERHEKKMEALATGFFFATFPYWYWKDQRDYRKALRRADEERRLTEGWEWVGQEDLPQEKERRDFDPDAFGWED